MKIKQITSEEFRRICNNGKPVIIRTVGVSIHEPKEKKEMSDKITKFIQIVIFEAKKVKDEFEKNKLEKGNAIASMMIGKDVPVFSLKNSEIEEIKKTGISQHFGDKMSEVSGVSAVIIGDEILFCSPIGTVSSLELYADIKSSAARLGSIKSDKKSKTSAKNGLKGGRPNLKYSIESKISSDGWDDELGIFAENSSVLNSKKEAIKALARAKREARNLKYTKEFIASLCISIFDKNEFEKIGE